MAAALGVSCALHAAALAALLLLPGRAMDGAGEAGSVALVFADTAALAGAAAEAEAAPAVPSAPPAPASPPDAPAPSAPPGAPASVAAPADPAVPSRPADPEPPPPPAPVREADAPLVRDAGADLPPPPPAPPPVAAETGSAEPPRQAHAAARPPPARATARAEPNPVRLDAGAGALPDPSIGARATGAVVPPGVDGGYRNPPPDYPAESRRRGEEGVVRLRLRVSAEGRVEQADIVASSGHPALDRAAVAATRQWRFRPASQAGLPVTATLATAVHFRLTDR